MIDSSAAQDRIAQPRHLRAIDLNLFVLFDAIYSQGGVTAAGRALGLTQPAVSHALGRLRQALGDPLFVRQGSSVIPTSFARHIIGDVRRALGILEGRLQDHRRFDPVSSQSTFRIALRDGMEAVFVPPLIARLASEAPNVTIVSSRVARRDIEIELASGRIDLAIDVTVPVGIGIRRETLFADRLVVGARKGHSGLRDGLTFEAYLSLAHILVSSRVRGPGLEDFELNRLGGHRRHVALRCHSYLAGIAAAACSDLLLTATEGHLRGAMHTLPLELYPLPFKAASVDLMLYWHTDADADPANAWLRTAIRGLAVNDRE